MKPESITTKEITPAEIEEVDMNTVPGFYSSITDRPITDRVGGSNTISSGTFRIIEETVQASAIQRPSDVSSSFGTYVMIFPLKGKYKNPPFFTGLTRFSNGIVKYLNQTSDPVSITTNKIIVSAVANQTGRIRIYNNDLS